MTDPDFQVGDVVQTITATVVDLPGCYRVRVRYHDDTEAVYHTDYVELVERPKRKLRVGSVWECKVMDDKPRYTVVATNQLSWADARGVVRTIGRDGISLDTDPELWREVPVEELEREAADGS